MNSGTIMEEAIINFLDSQYTATKPWNEMKLGKQVVHVLMNVGKNF